MSMFDAFLKNFGPQPAVGVPTVPTPGPAPTPTNNPTVPSSATPAPNPADPSVPAALRAGQTTDPANPTPSPEKSPLSEFSNLWHNDPNAPKQPSITAPTFAVDPAKILEAAKTIDFGKLVPADVMTKALGGDSTAFQNALNTVTQAAFAQSAMTTAKIVEAALTQQADKFKEILPVEVRKLQVSNQLQTDNPLFSNPAVSPMLKVLEAQLTAKYPTAPANEISKVAKEYLTQFADAVARGNNPASPAQGGNKLNGGSQDDWSTYFGVG